MGGLGQASGRLGTQLDAGVEQHVLNTGLLEQRGPIDLGEDGFFGLGGARIAVVKDRLDDLAGCIEEHVVHAPRVGADAGDHLAKRTGTGQAGADAVEQRRDVPVHPIAVADRRVAEAGKLLERDAAVLERAEHHPAALSAEVDGQIAGSHPV